MRESSEERIRRRAEAARRPDAGARANTYYGRGRICPHEGCETVLSIYNPGPFCGVHAEFNAVKSFRVRGSTAAQRLSSNGEH